MATLANDSANEQAYAPPQTPTYYLADKVTCKQTYMRALMRVARQGIT